MFQSIKAYLRNEFRCPSLVMGALVNPFYLNRRPLYKALKSELEENYYNNVLDVGCGSKPYRALFRTKSYIGIDVEVSGHDHANSEIDEFFDGINIPFPDNSFDLVFSSQVFEHVEHHEELLDEIHRVLAPGGKLILTIPFVWPEHEEPFDFRRYTSFGLTQFCEKHNLSTLKVEKIGNGYLCIGSLLNAQLFSCLKVKLKILKLALWFPIGALLNILFAFTSRFFSSQNPRLYTDLLYLGFKN